MSPKVQPRSARETAARLPRIEELDPYHRGNGQFLRDLLASSEGDTLAGERLQRHQTVELERRTRGLSEAEKRAVTSSLFTGGIIPPAYVTSLYAKAARNGRVYADQVNKQVLPDEGMTLTIARLTQGTAAGIQATENTTATTQDPTDTDLPVPVRTITGYAPVARQVIDRGNAAEFAIIEDLVARYHASLDSQCINGSGNTGQILGVLQTSGIATSTAGSTSGPVVLSKIEDCCQQIETSLAGVAGIADKIVMHPRRWRWLCALSDTTNVRPFVLPDTDEPEASNASPGYVGKLANLSVYIDPNIPVNQGAGTNQDVIIVMCSSLVNLWERPSDPMTFRFDQQAATSLQVQLVVEGLAAFSAGRYPLASGVVSGAGLITPTFP